MKSNCSRPPSIQILPFMRAKKIEGSDYKQFSWELPSDSYSVLAMIPTTPTQSHGDRSKIETDNHNNNNNHNNGEVDIRLPCIINYKEVMNFPKMNPSSPHFPFATSSFPSAASLIAHHHSPQVEEKSPDSPKRHSHKSSIPSSTIPIHYTLSNHHLPTTSIAGNNSAISHCIMCGRNDVEIPSQNKNICKVCDSTFWLHLQYQFIFKFCKGCKNFFALTEFKDKPEGTKCMKCRERVKNHYQLRKQLPKNVLAMDSPVPPSENQQRIESVNSSFDESGGSKDENESANMRGIDISSQSLPTRKRNLSLTQLTINNDEKTNMEAPISNGSSSIAYWNSPQDHLIDTSSIFTPDNHNLNRQTSSQSVPSSNVSFNSSVVDSSSSVYRKPPKMRKYSINESESLLFASSISSSFLSLKQESRKENYPSQQCSTAKTTPCAAEPAPASILASPYPLSVQSSPLPGNVVVEEGPRQSPALFEIKSTASLSDWERTAPSHDCNDDDWQWDPERNPLMQFASLLTRGSKDEQQHEVKDNATTE